MSKKINVEELPDFDLAEHLKPTRTLPRISASCWKMMTRPN